MFAVPYHIECKSRIVNLLHPTWVTHGEISHRGALPVEEQYDTVASVERRYNELLVAGQLSWINGRSDELRNWMGVCGYPWYSTDILEFSSKLSNELETDVVVFDVSFLYRF